MVLKPFLSVVLFFVMNGTALAGAKEKAIHVSIEREGHVYQVEGVFNVPVSSAVAWNVLSDYNHLEKFVSSILSSHLTVTENGDRFVHQEMKGSAGIFHKRVVLDLRVTETAPVRIEFSDTSHKSFKTYTGSWDIHPSEDTVEVRYVLSAQSNFFLPGFMGGPAYKRQVSELLEEVRSEMMKQKNE